MLYGKPGAEVTITDADGKVLATATVDTDGYWEASVALGSGPHSVHVSDGNDTIDLPIVGTDEQDGTPTINGAAALGALVAASAGVTLTARRRKATAAV